MPAELYELAYKAGSKCATVLGVVLCVLVYHCVFAYNPAEFNTAVLKKLD